MPGGDIYQAWANATPTIPFPFQYQDKKVGKIQQTWADVRSGIQRDAISTALPFCTSHITPTIVQVNIISDAIKKENQFQRKWEHASVERARSAAGDISNNQSGLASASSSVTRRALRSAQEQDALMNSEGGRGRKTYLKLRQQMDPHERYQGRPRTAAQQYGWNIEVTRDAAAQYRNISSALSASHGSTVTGSNHVLELRNLTSSASTTRRAVSACSPSIRTDSVAEKILTDALEQERKQCGGLDRRGTIATSLTMTSRGASDRTDFRRKNILHNNRRASGVFSLKE
jgi:hypothetical protein